MGSLRSSPYLTARSTSPISNICAAEKPDGEAMPSRFRLSLPPRIDRCARFSVVVSLREVVLCFSTVLLIMPSMARYPITPATIRSETITRTVRRTGFMAFSGISVCARTCPAPCASAACPLGERPSRLAREEDQLPALRLVVMSQDVLRAVVAANLEVPMVRTEPSIDHLRHLD